MIIDALRYILQVDSGQAESEVQGLRKSTDDLTESMKQSEAQGKKSADALLGYAKGVLGFLGLGLSASQIISGAATRAEEIAGMSRLADSIGVAVGEVDALSGAFQRAGATGEQAQGLLLKVTEDIGKAAADANSKEAKTFAALGIRLKDAQGRALDAASAVSKIAGAVEGLDKASARVKLQDLGISDEKTIELLMRGRTALDALVRRQKDQGVVSKETAQQAVNFTNAMQDMRAAMGSLSGGFMERFIPALTTVIQWLTRVIDFAAEHQDAVVAFFSAIAAVVAWVYLPAMISAAAATIAATWPLILMAGVVVAAAAAFALLYDDIVNFMEGNNSMIGQIFEKYPLVEKAVRSLIDVFKQYWAAVKWVFAQAGTAVDAFASGAISTLDAMGKSIVAIFKWLVDAIKVPLKAIQSGLDAVKSGAQTAAGWLGFDVEANEPADPNAPPPEYGSAVPSQPPEHAVPGARQGQPGPAALGAQAAQVTLAAAAAEPINNVTSNTLNSRTQNSETNVAVGEVKIVTQAQDAGGIARDVRSGLEDQLKNLQFESASGVAR